MHVPESMKVRLRRLLIPLITVAAFFATNRAVAADVVNSQNPSSRDEYFKVLSADGRKITIGGGKDQGVLIGSAFVVYGKDGETVNRNHNISDARVLSVTPSESILEILEEYPIPEQTLLDSAVVAVSPHFGFCPLRVSLPLDDNCENATDQIGLKQLRDKIACSRVLVLAEGQDFDLSVQIREGKSERTFFVTMAKELSPFNADFEAPIGDVYRVIDRLEKYHRQRALRNLVNQISPLSLPSAVEIKLKKEQKVVNERGATTLVYYEDLPKDPIPSFVNGECFCFAFHSKTKVSFFITVFELDPDGEIKTILPSREGVYLQVTPDREFVSEPIKCSASPGIGTIKFVICSSMTDLSFLDSKGRSVICSDDLIDPLRDYMKMAMNGKRGKGFLNNYGWAAFNLDFRLKQK